MQKLNIEECPVICLDDLTDSQRRAYTLIHNQLTMNTGWDADILSLELEDLTDDFDMDFYGFDLPALETRQTHIRTRKNAGHNSRQACEPTI